MTVTPPRTRPHGRFAARLVAILAAVALSSGVAVAPAAASPSPTPTPTATVPTGAIVFTLAPIRNGIFTPGEPLTASVTVDNDTTLPTAATPVTLELGTAPLAGRTALSTWLSGDISGVELTAVGTGTLDPVTPGDARTTGITAAAEQPALAGLAPGIHPIVASYVTPTGPVRSTSVVVVPTPGLPIEIGVVVPITAGVHTEALLTAAELAELTAEGGSLTKQLDGVAQTPAVLAVDPAILAAIRVLGVSAPASAIAWLDRLDALPNTRFALQFGDADPAVQVDAGLARPVEPTSLSTFLRPADFPISATPTPTPTATPTEPVSALPSRDELLDVEPSREAVFWPAVESVTPSAVSVLGGVVEGDHTGLTIIPSSATTAGGARGVAGEAGVLVYDTDLSRELSAAASVDESALRAAPLAAASAYLSLASAEAGGAPVLAAIDRGTDRSHIALQTAIAAAAEYPGAVSHSLPTLSALSPRAVTVTDAAPPAARVTAATELFVDEAELVRFATILDDPLVLTGPERATILQLLAVGWAQQPTEASAAVTAHREETLTTLQSVQLLPPTTINLFAAGAGLPFTVRNDLPYSVNLVLYATPDDLRLGVRRANEIVATPQSNTRVEVPVEARVGNGEVTLDLQLRSPSFVAIGPAESVDVNVRAEWEAVGIVVLSVLVGGLVLLGVVRTVLRARARRAAKNAPATDADETAGNEES